MIIPYVPIKSELNATNGVTKYPYEAISGVDIIINKGFDNRVNANTDGIATIRKYFKEYLINAFTSSNLPLS